MHVYTIKNYVLYMFFPPLNKFAYDYCVIINCDSHTNTSLLNNELQFLLHNYIYMLYNMVL